MGRGWSRCRRFPPARARGPNRRRVFAIFARRGHCLFDTCGHSPQFRSPRHVDRGGVHPAGAVGRAIGSDGFLVRNRLYRGRRGGRCVGHRFGRLVAGQRLGDLLAHHHVAFLGHEAHDQAHLALRPPRLVPRHPDAIGVADVRFAIVLGQLLGREHEFPVGAGFVLAGFLFKSVDHQRPVDLHRLAAGRSVEHQPAAKTATGRLVGMIQQGVGPHRHHLGRRLRIVF